MDALDEQLAQRGVHGALPRDAALAFEGSADDLDGEVRFAAAAMAGMAAVLLAVIDHGEMGWSEGGGQAGGDLGGHRADELIGHFTYIERLGRKGQGVLADGSSERKRGDRFHGRVDAGERLCAEPGCNELGEFRAPGARRPGFDGPGEWRWLCLDHVRAFNGGYNFFEGMSPDEIDAQQRPFAGWERETRAFSANPHAGPRWSDFTDPLDAIGARYAEYRKPRSDGRPLSEEDRRSLRVLGLGQDADRRALRQRYAELVRRYHPDRNGGDRSHESALQAVIAAYTHLKSQPAFA